MKIYRIIFMICFFLILLIPIVFINIKVDQISEIDNAKLPEISEITDLASAENYVSKRIGFRNQIINIYTKLNDKIFKRMVHPSYTYGTDGYVFFKTDIENHDDEYLNTFANFVKKMQNYVEERGSYFLFVINPSKISVYEQYLPKGYNFNNYRVTYLKNKLDELNINYIDNTDYIIELSKDYQVFNKKYDAGHWNDIGAFYGINNIYKKIKENGINITELDINDYNVSSEIKTTLPVSEFEIEEEIPVYSLINKNYIANNKYNDIIKISESYKYYLHTINKNVNNDYNVLFFRGSYMNSKDKFISNKFSQTYLIHNYDNSINFDYYYNIANPDVVLFEVVDYALNEKYYSSKDIKTKEYNNLYENYKNLKIDQLSNIDTNKIVDLINTNSSSNKPLTEIKLEKQNFKYAYLKVNERIYDFCYDNNVAYIELDTELLYNNSVELIVISEDLQFKQIAKIK